VREKTPVSAQRSAKAAEPSSPMALVRRHDRDRFQTALFAPAARRDALFALYAFNYEIARLRELVSEPTLGRIRLEWWRENIAAAYAGGPVRRHPVVEALTGAIREARLTRAGFDRLLAARDADFDEDPPHSLVALEDYAEATSSTLVGLALEALGVREPAAFAAGRHVGIAYALAGLLRAIPFRAGTRRPIIPADLAVRAGLDPHRHPMPPGSGALCAAVALIAAAAVGHLREARGRCHAVPRAALPALLPAVIAERSLRRLERAGHDPFDAALAHPDPLQSWRLASAALRHRF
jgi:NADH dehydrogenase [ubiquinone] 1 alpha subcomplex assembly factor 6